MSRSPRVLDPKESYTFSNYFESTFDLEDILADLGCTAEYRHLALPQTAQSLNGDRLTVSQKNWNSSSAFWWALLGYPLKAEWI